MGFCMGGRGDIQVLFVGKELRGLLFGGVYTHRGRGILEFYGEHIQGYGIVYEVPRTNYHAKLEKLAKISIRNPISWYQIA